jgi:hypothetical protein
MMANKRPTREQYLEARVKALEDSNTHLTDLVHRLLDSRQQRAPAPLPLPTQPCWREFDPKGFDPTDTLPAGIRAADLMRLAGLG